MLVFYCCHKRLQQISGLKQHPFILLQFCRLQVQYAWLLSLHQVSQDKSQGVGRTSGDSRESLFPGSKVWLIESRSVQLQNQVPFPSWLSRGASLDSKRLGAHSDSATVGLSPCTKAAACLPLLFLRLYMLSGDCLATKSSLRVRPAD